jgi:hypothetical protein
MGTPAQWDVAIERDKIARAGREDLRRKAIVGALVVIYAHACV